MKNTNGLKTLMLLLAEEEKTNKALISAFKYARTPDSTLAPRIIFCQSSCNFSAPALLLTSSLPVLLS